MARRQGRRFPAVQHRLRGGALLGREVDMILLTHGHRSGVARRARPPASHRPSHPSSSPCRCTQNDTFTGHCAPCFVGLAAGYGVATASQINPVVMIWTSLYARATRWALRGRRLRPTSLPCVARSPKWKAMIIPATPMAMKANCRAASVAGHSAGQSRAARCLGRRQPTRSQVRVWRGTPGQRRSSGGRRTPRPTRPPPVSRTAAAR